jgi:N-acetylglucosaminyldiphosphoundecaprenol N-acetyl-beta-D-mannosaminyltransferase
MAKEGFKTVNLFDYKVFGSELDIIETKANGTVVINTINAYSYVIAKRDPLFREALESSSVLVPDGFPIVVAARFLRGEKIKKIAGADVFFHFCEKLNREKGRCFFMGSSLNTLERIKNRLSIDYPNLVAGFYSPPFKKEFSDEENREILKHINEFAPEVLFVGMTAPKQEKWVHRFSHEINTKIITSIGAVFDFYAGTVERPSQFWIKLNLEWFIRLLKEPKRLWRRYLIYSPVFFVDMLIAKCRIRKK